MKKQPTLFQGRVESVAFPNKGTVLPAVPEHSDEEAPTAGFSAYQAPDHPVHVKNVLPGQIVEVFQSPHQRKRREGTLRRVIRPASYEVPSRCPHADICGGCSYQTVSYDIQLSWKEDMVRKLLTPVLDGESYAFSPIVPSPLVYAYRNKMEFSFGDAYKGGPLALGLHKQNAFHDIVPVEHCQIVHPDYGVLLAGVQQYFQQMGASFYHSRSHEGLLRHLVIRRSFMDGSLLVNLVTSSQGVLDEEAFVQKILSLPLEGKVTGILHTVNDSLADVVKPDQVYLLYGKDYLTERLLGLTFRLSAFSFFQTNTQGAERLYETIRNLAGDVGHKTVFDLYCGTGTIAQIMAGAGAGKVLGIELVEEAVRAAKENARLNGLKNCSFLAGDVLKLVDTLQEKPDLIILDPPRDGIHPKALPKILAYAPEQFIYVSCKPTSLVRDLPAFLEAGYRVETVQCVDMFPGTVHVETVVLLSKGEVDSKKIRVEFSLEDMDMSEFQDGATYPQIKEYVLEHTGLKVSNLYISQIKRKCGIEVGKNYNLPKSEDSRQPQCPPEKEKAIREAFKYFGMI